MGIPIIVWLHSWFWFPWFPGPRWTHPSRVFFQCHWHIFGRPRLQQVRRNYWIWCSNPDWWLFNHLSSAIYLNHSWLYVPWMNIPIMIIIYPCLVVHIPHELVRQNQTNHNLLNIPSKQKRNIFHLQQILSQVLKSPETAKACQSMTFTNLWLKLDHM